MPCQALLEEEDYANAHLTALALRALGRVWPPGHVSAADVRTLMKRLWSMGAPHGRIGDEVVEFCANLTKKEDDITTAPVPEKVRERLGLGRGARGRGGSGSGPRRRCRGTPGTRSATAPTTLPLAQQLISPACPPTRGAGDVMGRKFGLGDLAFQ